MQIYADNRLPCKPIIKFRSIRDMAIYNESIIKACLNSKLYE